MPSGYNRPNFGYNFARSSLDRSVPKEFTVMLIARRSASNARISCIIEFVGEGNFEQNKAKSSRYALYNVFRMISMLSSSNSAADKQSLKYGATN